MNFDFKKLLYSALLILAFAIPDIAMADRYATLGTGQNLVLADGETALIISCQGAFSTNYLIWPSSVPVTYAKDGAGSIVVPIPPAVFTDDDGANVTSTGGGPSTATPFPLVGPATITNSAPTGVVSIIGIRITSTEISDSSSSGGGSQQATEGVPSNSVVIPEDSAGPVEIILESSTDLVTWTAANPGTYGSSTVKRFFRVRAVENPAP